MYLIEMSPKPQLSNVVLQYPYTAQGYRSVYLMMMVVMMVIIDDLICFL